MDINIMEIVDNETGRLTMAMELELLDNSKNQVLVNKTPQRGIMIIAPARVIAGHAVCNPG